MERIEFITHRQKQVLFLDFSGCGPEEVATIADRVPEVVTREPLDTVLIVADFTGAEFNRNAVEHIKVAAAFDRPHVKRSAWVLNGNMPTALYDSVRQFSAREFPRFETREDALDYVVS